MSDDNPLKEIRGLIDSITESISEIRSEEAKKADESAKKYGFENARATIEELRERFGPELINVVMSELNITLHENAWEKILRLAYLSKTWSPSIGDAAISLMQFKLRQMIDQLEDFRPKSVAETPKQEKKEEQK